MSLRFRRILYSFFILAFLAITPLVMLYASGYKLNFQSLKGGRLTVEKTGMLILDSRPRGAMVFINNRPAVVGLKKILLKNSGANLTPAKIKNLSPGEYEIVLEKKGYWPWRKKLEVLPGSSTFAEDINLFRNNPPELLIPGAERIISLSPQKNLAVLAKNEVLEIFDLNREEALSYEPPATGTPPFREADSGKRTTWPPGQSAFFHGRVLYRLSEQRFSRSADFSGVIPEAAEIKWSAEDPNIAYYSDSGRIMSLDVYTGATTTLADITEFSDFLVKKNGLYLVKIIGRYGFLEVHDLGRRELLASIALPASRGYRFIHPEQQLINLYDEDNRIIYLMDIAQNPLPLRETIANSTLSEWAKSGTLLYGNDFEIWRYDLAQNRKTLLTRLGQGIKGIFWHPSENYAIYTTEQSINVIELDDRDGRNITTLLKLDGLDSPFVSADGKAAFFIAAIGNQQGLFKLLLQ